MSWEAANHVLKLADTTSPAEITPTQLLVLYTLAARHHRDARCAYGQMRRMVSDCHLNVDTILDSINKLEAAGYIRVYYGDIPLKAADGRSKRGNLYCFTDLDPEDGPQVSGNVEPRRRLGGAASVRRGPSQFSLDESGVGRPMSPANGVDESGQQAISVRPDTQTESGGLSSNLHNRPVNRTPEPEKKPVI